MEKSNVGKINYETEGYGMTGQAYQSSDQHVSTR